MGQDFLDIQYTKTTITTTIKVFMDLCYSQGYIFLDYRLYNVDEQVYKKCGYSTNKS